MPSENSAIVQYTASDGSEVKLSPSIVAKYIITGGKDVEEREIFSFIAKCQARKLNPLAGDAYMTCFKGKASVIVSKDYFMRTATQQPGYDGMSAGVVIIDRNGNITYRQGCIVGKQTEKLIGGWAEVYDKNRSHPSRAEVSMSEYDQHHSLWLSKPATMIRKVAIVQALREAYPGAYGGLYDRDGMPDPDSPEVPAQEVEPEQAEEAVEEPAEVYEPDDDAGYDYVEMYDHELDSDGLGLQQELAAKIRDLDRAVEEIKPRGTALSEAESAYRTALARKILELRADGMPVTIINDLARGDEDVALLRLKRDGAEVLYKSAFEAINALKLQIRIIEGQIGREWGRAAGM